MLFSSVHCEFFLRKTHSSEARGSVDQICAYKEKHTRIAAHKAAQRVCTKTLFHRYTEPPVHGRTRKGPSEETGFF